tara:strand:- start:242 stop:847 length:606 start_codon:yes stop_codon:yes gene_type:complete
MLALFRAKAELDRAIEAVPDYTGQWSNKYYYEDEQKAYDAAVKEYEEAHAPTSEEVKAHLLEHLDTRVKVHVNEGPDITVCVSLRWSDSEVIEVFGQDEEDDIREDLAALEHDQWAHWTKYMLEVLEPLLAYGRGVASVTGEHGWTDRRAIRAIEASVRWKRQIDTPYEALSEAEKDSDREWADKVLAALKAAPGRVGGEE